MQEEHALPPPPTHTALEAGLRQQCQDILLNDQCSTHRGCSKRKISACSKPGMAQLLHIPGSGGGKMCKLLGSSACLPGRHQELLLLLSKCSHHMHRDNMIPTHPSHATPLPIGPLSVPLLLLMLLLRHLSQVQLCKPIDSRPPGSTVPGILQGRTLEWVAISFSNA